MITLDTSAVIALLNSADCDFERVKAVFEADHGPWILPAPLLSEIGYLIEARFAPTTMDDFLADIEAGYYLIDCCQDDVPRIRELAKRYADMKLGLADATVIACAERNSGRVLTLDYHHFSVVARKGEITLVPQKPTAYARASILLWHHGDRSLTLRWVGGRLAIVVVRNGNSISPATRTLISR